MQQDMSDAHDAQADSAALAAAAALASVAAAAAAAASGQQLRWLHVTLCYSPPACSFHDAVCGACCCTGETLVPAGLHARCDATGYQLCELCPTRLHRGGPHRPHGGGRAHQSCIKALGRVAAAPTTPSPRSKRPYSALKPTQRWRRRCTARVVVAAVPSSACCPPTLSHCTHVRAASLYCASCRRARLSRRTCRPRRRRPWRDGAARRCCSHGRRAGSCHVRRSIAQRSRQCYSRACRAGPSRCCLAQLATAHLAHRCWPPRLLPWRTPQAVSRFARLFRALRWRRILLAALRSLCCGSACAVPCCARSTLLAHFAVGLSIALQTQQRACRPFLCSADVDT
jgi:hypothetical protein